MGLDHLTEMQVYAWGFTMVGVCLALLIAAIVWPMGERRRDRDGFQ